MPDYLSKIYDWNRQDLTDQYDELPLWSSDAGRLLLNNFPIGQFSNYLDVGCGTGFPLIDISQRLGNRCTSYGIDPWNKAIKRAQFKIDMLELSENIKLIDGNASNLSFPSDFFDLITSNFGINNFDNPTAVLNECQRVLKPGASFCLTTNLKGNFEEFYEIFNNTLSELEMIKYQPLLEKHIDHRGTIDTHSSLLNKAGFTIKNQLESRFVMRYYDGSAFLNHSVIASGFFDSWRAMIEPSDRPVFFTRLEKNLNRYAEEKGEFRVSIPIVYFECVK